MQLCCTKLTDQWDKDNSSVFMNAAAEVNVKCDTERMRKLTDLL